MSKKDESKILEVSSVWPLLSSLIFSLSSGSQNAKNAVGRGVLLLVEAASVELASKNPSGGHLRA
jgi:hypothetical protein